MEVLVGPTFGVEASAASPLPSSAFVPVQDRADVSSSSSRVFLNGSEDDVVGDGQEMARNCYGWEDGSSSDSSIGSPGDSDDEQGIEDENDGVSSSKKDGLRRSNFSLDSLDDSLPIKRGLSNHYSGKSKSFGNLSEVSSTKDIEKVENPFNKRRRVLIANKWSKKFFYSRLNPKSMPLLPVIHDEDDEKTDDCDDDESSNSDHKQGEEQEGARARLLQNQSRLKICSKSMSCFALGDLLEKEDEDED